MFEQRLRTSVTLVGVLLSACGGSGSQPPTQPAKTLSTLQLFGPDLTLSQRGQHLQFVAQGTYSDGTAQDVTVDAAWSSSDATVVTVSGGLVTAVANGTATIQATYQGRTDGKAVKVNLSGDTDWVFLGPVYTSTGASDVRIEHITVDPRDPSVLYVLTDGGFFISRNAGASWTETSSTTFARRMAIDSANPDHIVYGSAGSLLSSTDSGKTWSILHNFGQGIGIESVLISRLDPHTMFVAASGPTIPNAGLYKSTNGGVDWEAHPFPYMLSGASQFISWDIGEDPIDGTLYAPTEINDHPQPYRPPAFRSDDRGATWKDVTGSLPWHGMRVIVQPSHEVLFLTEGAGLYRSADRGATWNRSGKANFAQDLLIDPNAPSRFFGGETEFGGRPGGVFISNDGGLTFSQFGLAGLRVATLAMSADSSRLYVGCYNSGIYVRRLP
jgi:hypothetical protein